VLLRDRGAGSIRAARDGRPRVRYRLAGDDARRLLVGVAGATRILEAAGARRIRSSHARGVVYEPGRASRERFVADVEREGFAPGRCALFSFHHMGSARVGGSPAGAACGWDGETWEMHGLYVMDGSSFPSASGVNPMLTIEAIAHINASRLAAVLT
jgi:choline dehydrogenase-like flavoprotein